VSLPIKKNPVSFITGILLLAASFAVSAVPNLQLGIVGGYYDTETESVVSNSSAGTLVAYGGGSDISGFAINDEYFISIALLNHDLSSTGPDLFDFGSFDFGGITYDVDDVVYGVPPLEANLDHDAGDLSTHSVFPTLFVQHQFKFSATQKTALVNTQDTPGFDPVSNPGNDLYYKLFNVDMSNMTGSLGLHFDLYNTTLVVTTVCVTPPKPAGWKGKWKPAPVCTTTPTGDVDRNDFAPYSHDATMVPEPAPLMLLGIGMLILSVSSIRRLRVKR
jgi:hypothetical protein